MGNHARRTTAELGVGARCVVAAGVALGVSAGLCATAAAVGTVPDLATRPTAGPVYVTAALAVEVPVVGTPVRLARAAQSPCTAITARYRAAQRALAGGDIDSADDLALIAAHLIDQCGWTRVDTATGART